jgi:hypothetical protein
MEELDAEYARNDERVRRLTALPKHRRERFTGMTMAAIGRDPVFRALTMTAKAPRRVAASSGRPRAGATRSSVRSGDPPADDDDGPSDPGPVRGLEYDRGTLALWFPRERW